MGFVVLGLVLMSTTRLGSRVVLDGEDGSVLVRQEVYWEGLKLLLMAPEGWGWGRATEAHSHWVSNQDHSLLNLLSSHLTWCVEGGWLFTSAYVMLWGVVGLGLLTSGSRIQHLMPAAMWIALACAAAFSHVLRTPWVWIWMVLLVGIWILRLASGRFSVMKKAVVGCAGLLFAGCLAGLLFAGGDEYVVMKNGIVYPAEGQVGKPESLYVGLDEGVLGRRYGAELRDGPGGWAVLWTAKRTLEPVKLLVLSGPAGDCAAGGGSPECDRVLWLNPPDFRVVEENGADFLTWLRSQELEVVWGAQRRDSNPRRWLMEIAESERWSFRSVEAGVFLGDWLGREGI